MTTTTKRTSKPTATKTSVSRVRATGSRQGALTREERIAKLAYSFAESYGFTSDSVQDWLAAEKVIDGR